MRPEQKIAFKTTDVEGLIFVSHQDSAQNSIYALVTDFDGTAMKTRQVPQASNLEELQKWVKQNLQIRKYQTVEVKLVKLPAADAKPKTYYVVGHRTYQTADEVKKQIDQAKKEITANGSDFSKMVMESRDYYFPPLPEPTPGEKAQFQKEEELILKYMDQLDIGNELFGPFQGDPSGEPILWQSFGEHTWRLTNLEDRHYNASVGYWTNRIVFKGIKAPMNTIDPYVELTVNLDGTGIDFKSNFQTIAGLEWRPFTRSAWLSNFRPWSLHLLDFVKNYRFFVEYIDRRNLKNEIDGKNFDWQAGLNIFYEWGVEVPPLGEGKSCCTIPDYIRKFIWGEYFGDYYYAHTQLSAEDQPNAFIFNSSLILGVKLPGIPLPPNPINDELALMPYMRFEHVNNSEFSSPSKNQYFVAAGLRIMPFMTQRYKDNQWLAKTKLFVEYVGIGDVKNWKQNEEAPNTVHYDLRAGVSFSSNRR